MPISNRAPAESTVKRNLMVRLPGCVPSARTIKVMASTAAPVTFGLGAPLAEAQGMAGVYVPEIYLPGLYLRGLAGAAFGTDMMFKDVNARHDKDDRSLRRQGPPRDQHAEPHQGGERDARDG